MDSSVLRGLLASLTGAALLVSATPVLAQAPSGEKPYAAPRTPWGHPDLQGVWTSDDARGVPLQRPAEMGERQWLTDEEYAERKKRNDETREDTRAGAGTFVGEVGTRTLRQTSLVIEPRNGRIPALTPEAQQRANAERASRNPLPASWHDRSMMERCITRGVTGILPTIYGNGLQIVQSPDSVVINHEMIHEARVIPLDPRPHVGAPLKTYMGDPRGRWEGNTLVIETTNFTDRTSVGNSRHSESLRLIERLTRVDADMIEYEITVEDPKTWVSPWKILLPLTTQPGYEVYPFECHEGNMALRNMLSAAREEERVAEEYIKKGLPPPPVARPGDANILPPDPSFGRRTR